MLKRIREKDIADEFNDTNLFQSIMDNTADSVYFKDRNCRLIRVSRRMADSLGFNHPDELIGKTDIELFGKEFGERTRLQDLKVMETGQPIIGLVESRRKPDGKDNWTSTTKLPLRNGKGEIYGLFGITREINELKQVENDLQFLATHDVLTSLPNRYLLFDRMEQAIFRAQRNATSIAILFVDLDDFKNINDSYGHAVGDLILVQIATQLKRHIRELDTVSRFGGDEFVIVLEQVQDENEVRQIARRIVKDIYSNAGIDPVIPPVTVSIGISLFPQHGKNITRLMWCADNAMYRAKIRKNAFEMYIPNAEDSEKG
jgi:diguanylate cyclase (GGDEF)-like protein/PAS domain S-box-containing protein